MNTKVYILVNKTVIHTTDIIPCIMASPNCN